MVVLWCTPSDARRMEMPTCSDLEQIAVLVVGHFYSGRHEVDRLAVDRLLKRIHKPAVRNAVRKVGCL